MSGQSSGVESRFGFIPLFIAPDGSRHDTFADAIDAAGSLTLDFQGINVFLRTGVFLNGRTPFREIRRWCPDPVIVEPKEVTRTKAISAYIDLFRQAVARRVVEHSVMGLSGGRDSRHILLELCAQGAPPRVAATVVLPDRPAEGEVATALASTAGVPHEEIRLDSGQRIEIEEHKNLDTGFVSLQHAWIVPFANRVRQEPCWDGIGGDVLSAGLFLDRWKLELFENSSLDELADRLVSRGRVSWSRDQTLFPREPVVEEIRTELAKHTTAANPVGSFYFWNRTRIDIGSSAFGLLERPLAPYLDEDLWEFLSSLPAHLLIDRRFHSDTIATAFPEFENVPYWDGEKVPHPKYEKALWAQLLSYCLKHGAYLDAVRCLRGWGVGRYRRDVHALLPLVVWREGIRQLARGSNR